MSSTYNQQPRTIDSKARAFVVFFDKFQKDVFSDRASGGAAVVALAFTSAFDHHRDGDLRIFNWCKAEEPCEIYLLAVGAKVSGAGFSADTKTVNFNEPASALDRKSVV